MCIHVSVYFVRVSAVGVGVCTHVRMLFARVTFIYLSSEVGVK